jgi:uncharacterized protein YegL
MNRLATSLLIIALVAILLPKYSTTNTKDGFRASLYVRDPKYAASKIPLQNFDVQVDVIDFLAKVQITQVYKNEEEHPLECIYKFPMDEKSAITEFKAEIDGNVVVALSKPRQQALQEYNDAIERGHTAYLMEEERADIFTVNVGNLPARKEAKITVTYLTELTLEGDDLRFTLPTTIAPRYVPAVDAFTNDHRSTDATLNPPSQATVPYKFGLNVDLQMPSRIVKVASPSHPISVELNGLKGNVKLSGAKPMDTDFVLTVNLQAPHEPRAWIETIPGLPDKAVLVALYPDLEVKEETIGDDRVVVFIVDVSGSMDGEKMKNVKDALRVSLDDIKRRSDSAMKKFERSNFYFNIIAFSSDYKALFDAPVLADQANYDTAMKFVESLAANGGTELYEPLKYVLERSVNDKTKQNVIVITDGEISDTDRTIAMVGEEKHKRFNRVFAVGIGYGVSHLLVNGLARAGDGIAEFVIPGEEVIEKINRQMQRALGSNSQEVQSVGWTDSDEAKIQFQTPYSLPTLYEGSRLLAYAMITGPVPDKFIVKTAKGDIILEKTAVRHIHGDTIHKLAARSRIRDLEESRSEIHLAHEAKVQEDRSGNFRYGRPLLDEESASKVKSLIIDLAQRYNLMSRETSFIAVDTTQENDPSKTQQVVVPIQTVREEAGQHRAYGAGAFMSSKSKFIQPHTVRSAYVDPNNYDASAGRKRSSATGLFSERQSYLIILVILIVSSVLLGFLNESQ